jgi:tryptophan synthase alpha chain
MSSTVPSHASRFSTRFATLKEQEKQAFIPFTLLGWPNVETCKATLRSLIEANPSALELGLPFSEPVADGPVIQQAVTEALEAGYTLEQGLECLRYARSLDADIPIGVLGYYNTVLAQGKEPFFIRLKEAGADACLIADLPPEAAHEIKPAADAAGMELIFIVSQRPRVFRPSYNMPVPFCMWSPAWASLALKQCTMRA